MASRDTSRNVAKGLIRLCLPATCLPIPAASSARSSSPAAGAGQREENNRKSVSDNSVSSEPAISRLAPISCRAASKTAWISTVASPITASIISTGQPCSACSRSIDRGNSPSPSTACHKRASWGLSGGLVLTVPLLATGGKIFPRIRRTFCCWFAFWHSPQAIRYSQISTPVALENLCALSMAFTKISCAQRPASARSFRIEKAN